MGHYLSQLISLGGQLCNGVMKAMHLVGFSEPLDPSVRKFADTADGSLIKCHHNFNSHHNLLSQSCFQFANVHSADSCYCQVYNL